VYSLPLVLVGCLLSELVREAGADFGAWLPKLKKDPLVSFKGCSQMAISCIMSCCLCCVVPLLAVWCLAAKAEKGTPGEFCCVVYTHVCAWIHLDT
jgi:hypothetical protein